jgi:hypothetical protein
MTFSLSDPIMLLTLTLLLGLLTPIHSQNYFLKQKSISTGWLNSLGGFTQVFSDDGTTSQWGNPPGPEFQFTAFGSQYDVIPSYGGFLHFGDYTTQKDRGCCSNTCATYCNIGTDLREVSLVAVPLALKTLPANAKLSHSYFSNSTVYALRTQLTTSDFSLNYVAMLFAPSTIVLGIETPSGSLANPDTFFDNAFSGLIGSIQSVFPESPINSANLNTNKYPNPDVYPPSQLISYHRSQYKFGRAVIYCAAGGSACLPSFLSTTQIPLSIPWTTNSDNACFRKHNSAFLSGLLTESPSVVPSPPAVSCLLDFYDSEYKNKDSLVVSSKYDQTNDTFQCLVQSPYDIAPYSYVQIRLISGESTVSTTLPYQPRAIWTMVNYQYDFTTTTDLQFNSNFNLNPGDLKLDYVPLTTTPPASFPYPTTGPNSIDVPCHCKMIRYRGTPVANPSGFFASEFGRSVQGILALRPNHRPDPSFNTTITDSFYTQNDFCSVDCNGVPQGSAGFNNCGQCVSLAEMNEKYLGVATPRIGNNQILNCWDMCETLTPKNAGHFSYLMYYPADARINGLVMPNSPYTPVDGDNISSTPLSDATLKCASRSEGQQQQQQQQQQSQLQSTPQTQQSTPQTQQVQNETGFSNAASSTIVSQNLPASSNGFTTYRSHLSETLDPIQWFKVFSLILMFLGIVFSIYLCITFARAKQRKLERRKRSMAQRNAAVAAINRSGPENHSTAVHAPHRRRRRRGGDGDADADADGGGGGGGGDGEAEDRRYDNHNDVAATNTPLPRPLHERPQLPPRISPNNNQRPQQPQPSRRNNNNNNNNRTTTTPTNNGTNTTPTNANNNNRNGNPTQPTRRPRGTRNQPRASARPS